MKPSKLYQDLSRIVGSGLLCTGMLLAASGSQAAAQNEIAQVPPSVAEGVPPNMIFTLDESGSMSWAFVPDMDDGTSSVYYNKIGGGSSYNTRRMRAANANPMAYNPHVIYEIPPTFAQNGSEIELKTSFTNAPLNGFWLSADWSNTKGNILRDLSNNYRLAREHRQGAPDATNGGTLNWATHPADFGTQKFAIPSGNGPHYIGPNEEQQFRYEITRSTDRWGNPTCSAKVYMGAGNAVVKTPNCSISGNNVTVSNGLTGTGVPAYYYEFEPSYKRTTNGAVGSCGTFSDDSGTGKDAFAQSERCYRIVWVDETSAYDENGNRLKHPNGQLVDGKQNFAIWYSFYRSRALATLSAAKIAFYNLSPDVRFTWQNLKTCSFKELTASERKVGTTQLGTCNSFGLRPYTTKQRGEFYTWLRKTYFNVGTPLPDAMDRAGKFFTKPEPWQKTPGGTGNNDDNTYACRPSYHVLMTDGMWNENATTPPSSLRGDHSTFTTLGGEKFGGKEYDQQKPFYDAAGSSNPTLADLAMHYWATDLNTNLDNKIRPYIPYKNDDSDKEYWDPRNNPAEWQSMSNFIMALGLTTSMGTGENSDLPWAGTTYSGEGYAELLGGRTWPEAWAKKVGSTNTGSPNNVYDLWHAAINSRGEFYSVDSPEAMVQAFQDILTRIAERKSSAAMPGTSSAIEVFEDADGEEDGRLHQFFYQTTFNSADGWSGDLTKTVKYREFNNSTGEYEWVTTEGWSAANKLPSHDKRKIYMANNSGNLVEFKESNINSSALYEGKTLKQHLDINPDSSQSSAYSAKDRLNYLRGSDANAGEDDGKMRERSSKLGDFFGSEPVVVGNQGRYLEGFSNKLENTNSENAYSTFLDSIKSRKTMVYVGGNAGMLHAFNAETGVEEFAFVPTPVFPFLNKLTGKNYTHQYYVDGTPVVADVYDPTNARWRTILVGTLKAGGKGLFALDITDPDNISLLWELHDYSTEANKPGINVKPGYSFPKPTVARLHNGRWAVVTGNGYKATGTDSGKAALFVIDALSGELTKSMEVQARNTNGGVLNEENGLSTPRLADFDGDGIADYAYAGDLQGNLWRFDLLGNSANTDNNTQNPPFSIYGKKTDTGTTKFKVSYDGKAMFTARADYNDSPAQPITSAPSLVRHPTRLGYLVVFGTGRYVEIGDKEPNKSYAQSLYGVWDTKTKAETTGAPPSISRSNMTQQSFNSSDTTGKGETTNIVRQARILSNNPVEWYTDYNSTKPIKKRGWYVDFDGGGKQGEIMVEDMRTLGNTLFLQTLVPNDDPCANGAGNWLYAINPFTGGRTLHHAFDTRSGENNDIIVSGIQFGTEGGVSLGQDEEGYKAFAPGDFEPISPDPSSLGRQTWRMIQNP